MTLRRRLVLLTSTAVALAVLAASVAAWFLIRSTLMDEVDQRLRDRAPQLQRIGDRQVFSESDPSGSVPGPDAQVALRGDPIGLQEIEPDGEVLFAVPPGDVDLPLDAGEEDLLAEGEPGAITFRTATVDGDTYRVLSTVVDGNVFRLLSPLENVEATMTRMAWLLAVLAGIGVAIAGGLGWAIVRAGLRPVDQVTAAAEQVAATKDLAHRIEVVGNRDDEVARLAASVNAMLAALDAARTEQRRLVENAGHELRTPLTTLRNDIGLLVRAEERPDGLPPAAREELLRALDLEVAALGELVAELVDLGRGEVEPEGLLETDVPALVERAVARARRVNPEAAVTVRGDRFAAVVRPTMLERAVTNLVRNAVQVGGDTPVEVELVERDGCAVVRVLDRGPGIAAEDRGRIFDRFYRGRGARERHGSGLGLAIVAQAADHHDGTVDVANREGGGAVFTLRVPVRPSGSR